MSISYASRTRRLWSLVAAAALLLSTLPARVVAAPAGPVVATGVLRDASGHPMAGSVGLWYRDPDRDQLILAASASVGTDGAYTLHLRTPGALRRLAARNDGWLNLLLSGGSETVRGTVGLTRRISDGSWIGRHGGLAIDVVADGPVPVAAQEDARLFAAAAEASGSGTRVAARSIGSCFADEVATWSGWVVIGEVHTWTDHTARWTYGRTADSDIGIGIAYEGGGWKQSGTFHVGSSSSSSVTKVAGSRYGRLLKSRFEFVKYRWIGYCPFLPDYTIVPTTWLSGMVEGSSVRNYDGYCGSYYAANAAVFGADTEWSRDDRDYTKFSAAVDAFGVVSLSAQSGLSSNVHMTHTFGSASTYHRLCGSNDDILRAKRVFAG